MADLSKFGGFTPLIDIIVRRYGITTAAVFGRVWRYCQGEDKVCYATIGKIAKELELAPRTIIRHLNLLTREGLLEDLTPDRRNRPHRYKNSDRTVILISEAYTTESHSTVTQSHSGVTSSQPQSDTMSLEDRNNKEEMKEEVVEANEEKNHHC